MSNIGKYIDRNPCLRSAGFVSKIDESAGDTLKMYTDEDAAEALIQAKCKTAMQQKRQTGYPLSPITPSDNMKDIFSTELKKSRFVEFREKFSEELFFKKPELGKVFELYAKPDHITNENTTFGSATERSEPVYELLLPKKTRNEVNNEYIQWHDKYILSHNHYFPSERINRHYDRKNFNPSNTFGCLSNADITGGNVKRCLTRCEHLIVIKKSQKRFLEVSSGPLGKRNKRYELSLPPDTVFGLQIPRDKCDAKALIENVDVCVMQTELIESISHINKLRRMLFSRLNFHINDYKAALEERDERKTGCLSLPIIFEAAKPLRISMNPQKIRTALKLFNLLIDEGLSTERVNYEDFLKILQKQYPLPKTGNISTVADNEYNKITTYRELCKDMMRKPNEALEQKISKEEKTTATDLIAPNIPLRFGLGSSDFSEPRSKEMLQRIFKRVVTSTDEFEKIWHHAKIKLRPVNDLMSVNELRMIMHSIDQ